MTDEAHDNASQDAVQETGVHEEAHSEPVPLPSPPPVATPPVPLPKRKPGWAAFFAVLPGLGHVYNGLYPRAITFFAIFAALFGTSMTVSGNEEPFVILPMVFFWIFNVIDSYRQATLLNYGYTEDPASRQTLQTGLGAGGLVPGVALVALGLYGMLRKYFDFSLAWLFEHWPIFIILVGAFLIVQSLKARRDAALAG